MLRRTAVYDLNGSYLFQVISAYWYYLQSSFPSPPSLLHLSSPGFPIYILSDMRWYLTVSVQLHVWQWVSSWVLVPCWYVTVCCSEASFSISVFLDISAIDGICNLLSPMHRMHLPLTIPLLALSVQITTWTLLHYFFFHNAIGCVHLSSPAVFQFPVQW